MEARPKIKVGSRWLIRRDMPEVLQIDEQCFDERWTEEDFLCSLRERNVIGMVAEHDQNILGFMIYELHKNHLYLTRFAVHADYQRCCVGSQLIQKLIDKLNQQRRREIILEVPERNLEAQLFFKSLGFRAKCVLKDNYLMKYGIILEKESIDIPLELAQRNLDWLR